MKFGANICCENGRVMAKSVIFNMAAAAILDFAVIISSYHIVDLKRQNRLKVGTNKPISYIKVKMQSCPEKTS